MNTMYDLWISGKLTRGMSMHTTVQKVNVLGKQHFMPGRREITHVEEMPCLLSPSFPASAGACIVIGQLQLFTIQGVGGIDA